MRLIQDLVKGIKPTPEEAEEALEYFKIILPNLKHGICGGAVGDWRMLPNGATCFYCPPILLPDAKYSSGIPIGKKGRECH